MPLAYICIALILILALIWLISLMMANPRSTLYHCPKCNLYHNAKDTTWTKQPDGFDDLIRWQFCPDCEREYFNHIKNRNENYTK